MRVIWTPEAIRRLTEIQRYISQRNRRAAIQQSEKIDLAAQKLTEFPQLGRPGRIDGTRERPVPGTPYLIAYRVRDRVEILSLFHGRQNWPEAF